MTRPNTRRILVACLFIVAILPQSSCTSQNLSHPTATKKVEFEGVWDGEYKDNENRTGEGKYRFHKEKEGHWNVTVSWLEEGVTKEMPVKGERLGPDALRLQGRYKDTTYWYVGRMESQDGPLVLHYVSVDAKTGKSGSGVSTLTRSK